MYGHLGRKSEVEVQKYRYVVHADLKKVCHKTKKCSQKVVQMTTEPVQ